jgi:hypothetical protein
MIRVEEAALPQFGSDRAMPQLTNQRLAAWPHQLDLLQAYECVLKIVLPLFSIRSHAAGQLPTDWCMRTTCMFFRHGVHFQAGDAYVLSMVYIYITFTPNSHARSECLQVATHADALPKSVHCCCRDPGMTGPHIKYLHLSLLTRLRSWWNHRKYGRKGWSRTLWAHRTSQVVLRQVALKLLV